jgi:hypothetical protein
MSGHLGKGVEPWEKKTMGSTTQDRTTLVAQDVRKYREITNLGSNPVTQRAHDEYIHNTGAEMLKLQTTKSLLSNKEEKLQKKLRGKPRAPQKKVKVDLLDEDGFTIALDLEWDTSTWGNSEIEAGTEALINVFDSPVGPHRRQQAVRMLTKILERHSVAERTLQSNIGPIMHRAMSRRVRGGKCQAALNLLFALHTGMSRFYYEISSNNYMEQFWNMVQVEANLAATVIQHAFRTHRELKYTRYAPVGHLAEGWSTQEDVVQKRIQHLMYRGGELRTQWLMMHFYQGREDKKRLYGVKGPVHVPIVFMVVGMKICNYLISVKAKEHVHINRDDCLFVNAEILLMGFLSATDSEICQPALTILNSMSLNESSLRPFIRAGVLRGVIKYIQHFRHRDTNIEKSSVLVAISLLTRLGRHCAGLHRAKGGYDYLVKQADYCDDVLPSEVNYRSLYLSYKDQELDDYRFLLFNKKIAQELVSMFYEYSSIKVKTDILTCLYVMSGSICFTVVFEEITRLNGQLLQALVDLFDYEKGEETILGDVALALLIQLATYEPCRAGMRSSNILGMLKPHMKEAAYFPRLSYKRAALLLITLCRVGEWRSYMPSKLLHDVQTPPALNSITYMDMLKTIKQPPVESVFGFKELIVLETNVPMANLLAEIVQEIGCRAVIDFFTCPMSNFHFSTLPFEIAMAGCSVIAAIVSSPDNARASLSRHMVRYLGQCMNWAYSELSSKANSAKQGELLLHSVHACTSALVDICNIGVENKTDCANVFAGIQESQAADAAKYFMTVFTNQSNDDLPDDIRKLQDKVSFDCIRFIEKYAVALLFLKTPESDQGLEDLANVVGGAACNVVKELPRVMGNSPKATRVLDYICQLLSKLVATSAGRFLAFKTWKLCDVLLLHLPEPMCVAGDVLEEAIEYKNGIRDLPSSLFDVMTRLCQTDQGINICIADGFLRRALDKMTLIKNHLESEGELEQVSIAIAKGKPFPKNQLRADFASSLQLISKCSNNNHPKHGSSNDIILNPNFCIVEVCWKVVSSRACPRNDTAYLAALSVLRQLSKDGSRIYELFRDFEIIPMIHLELKRVGEISLEGIADCVDLVYNVAVGLRGAHLRAELPRMREALTKVSRVYVRLGQAVSDVLYSISRNHGKAAEDEEEVREGAIVTGGTQDMKDLMKLSTQQEREDLARTGKPGTYERCGISTCGGLGVPGGACQHGEFLESDPNTELKKMDLLVHANTTSDVCHLTKLSARDKKFHTALLLKKENQGYLELSGEDLSKLKLPVVSQTPPGSSASNRGSRTGSANTDQMWSPVKSKKKSASSDSAKKSGKGTKKRGGGSQKIASFDISELPELMNTRPVRPPPRIS